ncbi:hypothetical protein GCM10009634_18400 [Saccharothrix xinjiangensis]
MKVAVAAQAAGRWSDEATAVNAAAVTTPMTSTAGKAPRPDVRNPPLQVCPDEACAFEFVRPRGVAESRDP